jgi:hypothetical protein
VTGNGGEGVVSAVVLDAVGSPIPHSR